MNTHDGKHGMSPLSTGLGLAIAVALGASLGILFAPKKGSETQKDISEKASLLAKKFKKSRGEVQESVKNIFGEVTKELEESYLEVHGNILASLDNIKDEADLTQKKYNEIVQNAVDDLSKDKEWAEKSIKGLIKDLQKEWK